MKFGIQLAGKKIAIHSVYRYVEFQSEAFLCDDENPDFVITTTREEIEEESVKTGVENRPGYLESLVIYRKIALKMLDFDTFLMHGSVVAVGNEAFMITAKSGVGKTTRTDMWLRCIDGSYVVNGDKPLIKVGPDEVLACGTPWCGKENKGTNAVVPLKAIFFLERSDHNEITELRFTDVFPILLQQTRVSGDPEHMAKTIQLLKGLEGKVKLYRFNSNLEDDAVIQAYKIGSNDETHN